MGRQPRPSIAKAEKTPEPVDVQVGKLIQVQRIAIGMSQQQLADALGLSFQQVHKYEKGKNRVSSSRLVAIAATLQVTPAFFFSDAKDNGDPEVMTPLAINGAADLLRGYAAIEDVGTRAAITALVLAIARQSASVRAN